MSFIKGLLLDVDTDDISGVAKTAFEKFQDIINVILPIVLGVVLLVGTIYAVILGVQYSKAEDADKRKEAKGRLVGAVVGFLITLVIIAVIYAALALFLPDSNKKSSLPFEDYQYSQAVSVEKNSDFNTYVLTVGNAKLELEADDLVEDTNPANLKEKLPATTKIAGFSINKANVTELTMVVNGTKATVALKFTEGQATRSYSASKSINSKALTKDAISSTISVNYSEGIYTLNIGGKTLSGANASALNAAYGALENDDVLTFGTYELKKSLASFNATIVGTKLNITLTLTNSGSTTFTIENIEIAGATTSAIVALLAA